MLAGLLVVAWATPCVLSGQPPRNGEVEQELIKLEEACNDALSKNDLAFFERTFADDFVSTDDLGVAKNKAQFLAPLKSGDLKNASETNDEYLLHVYTNTAVVNFRFRVKGQFKGEDFSGQYRETDTWLRRDGHWECVAAHMSKIAEK